MKRLALFGSVVCGFLVAAYFGLPRLAAQPVATSSPEVPVVVTPTATPLAPTPTPFVTVATPTSTPEPPLPLGARCRLHGDLLQRDSVIVLYGLPPLELYPLYEARDKQFPNSLKDVGGGCMAMEGEPTHQNVLFCPTCRAEEEKWLAQHPKVKARMDEGK